MIRTEGKKCLSEGEHLFRIGDPVRNIYDIVSGSMKMTRPLVDGNDAVLHFVLAGEQVAEASLFADHYHCNAIATSPTTLRVRAKQEVLAEIERSPEFAKSYVKLLSEQVRQLRLQMEVRSIRSARARILRYLNVQSNAEGSVELATSLKEIANRIGLTHEAFYRELKKLETTGLIQRGEKTIKIMKPV